MRRADQPRVARREPRGEHRPEPAEEADRQRPVRLQPVDRAPRPRPPPRATIAARRRIARRLRARAPAAPPGEIRRSRAPAEGHDRRPARPCSRQHRDRGAASASASPSRARSAASRSARPMRAPLPWSPSRNPQPPIIRTAPPRCTPKTEPVPERRGDAVLVAERALQRDQRVGLDPRPRERQPLRPAAPPPRHVGAGEAEHRGDARRGPRRPRRPRRPRPRRGCWRARPPDRSRCWRKPPRPRPSTRPLASATAARQPDPPPSIPR